MARKGVAARLKLLTTKEHKAPWGKVAQQQVPTAMTVVAVAATTAAAAALPVAVVVAAGILVAWVVAPCKMAFAPVTG